MAQWNQLDKTLHTKIVYWGPALGGKTTNLQQLHAVTDPEGDNRLISVNTANDRTLFFDLLPLDMGKILGHSLRIQLYTVPGQVRYEATRRVVLSGADAVVFVADSQRGRGAENRAAWENLRANLKLNGLDPAATPIVVQYNKQDIPGCLHPKEVEACLQSGQQGIAASAIAGRGVLETFREAVLVMLRRLTVLTGRRRAEDVAALEEQVARAFARFESARAAQASQPAQAARAAQVPAGRATASPGCPRDSRLSRPPAPRRHRRRTIRMSEDAPGEDLLVRSLRATLGIAEQFGELREVKNRLARRVGELEGLQALVRELTSRREEGEILQGLADAAISIPGARAASVLRRAAGGGPLQEAVVRGAARDPLLGAGGRTRARRSCSAPAGRKCSTSLPLPGGAAQVEAGPVTSALAVPLAPEEGPAGLVTVYSDAPFEADDLRFLGLLVSHAAVCLDNAEFAARMKSHSLRLEDEVQERTAELQKANESLLELDRMKDRFLSSVSHEMRTPLTGILSGIELLTMLNNDIDGSREFLSMIEHEAKRLSNLVERILRFQVLGRTAGPAGARTARAGGRGPAGRRGAQREGRHARHRNHPGAAGAPPAAERRRGGARPRDPRARGQRREILAAG